MTTEEVTFEEYKEKTMPQIFYNTMNFNNFNKDKAKKVRYLLFKDNKYRFALCVGEKNNNFLIPFSAPFASFVPLKKFWKLSELYNAVSAFDEFAKNENINKILFTLPPSIYDNTFVSSLQNVLIQNGYKVKQQELNYSLKLDKEIEDYKKILPSNGRKNLNIALKNKNIKILHCKNINQKSQAYDIIAINRNFRGYPLRMTWEQVKNTIALVPHNFFILENENKAIASAIIFHITNEIAQVIYWGNIPDFSEFKPMNYLAYYLYGFYHDMNFEYLDIGPSTENGVPNFGLCDFKQSIGCDVSAKFVLEKIL